MNNKTNVLYIGRFELPDKEATANRVIGNSKLLKSLGYNVILAGWSININKNQGWVENSYLGFRCFEKHKSLTTLEKYMMFIDATPELNLIKDLKNIDYVIAYDFPAVALKKIINFCKKNKIIIIGDVSEWYSNGSKNFLIKFIRAYDSFLRMKILHKKMNGLIVISKYLQNYYQSIKHILIPPLVDFSEEKWINNYVKEEKIINFIYAGSPSPNKERLDYCINAILELQLDIKVHLIVIGINKIDYEKLYKIKPDFQYNNEHSKVIFLGKMSRNDTLEYVKKSNFSIIIREKNRTTMAGFPSKLVESITCGTPVISTNYSNVYDYLYGDVNGFAINIEENLSEQLINVIKNYKNIRVEKNIFNYTNYKEQMIKFMEDL